MLSDYKSLQQGTYGFRFQGAHQHRVAGLFAIGWEKQTSRQYHWDGLRRNESDIIVFQYTLAGKGAIDIAGTKHDLTAGQAFFIDIPSDHRYYLPSDSASWEFIHLTLFGEEARRAYESITDKAGSIITLDLSSEPVTQIITLLNQVMNNKITDGYEASALAYSFLMELQRFVLHKKDHASLPPAIAKAVLFIKNNYDHVITLDDIVDVSGLSKYHFTRLFHEQIHATPIQYLTKCRINESIKLLKNEAHTIEDIATMVGFSNGNYFIKVFRSFIGMPPGQFRESSSFLSVDQMILD